MRLHKCLRLKGLHGAPRKRLIINDLHKLHLYQIRADLSRQK